MPSPNDRGRANEAIFVETLATGLGVPVTSRVVRQARRDAPKILGLSSQTQRSLRQASGLVCVWHIATFGRKFSRIDRSDDSSPGTADVICEGATRVSYSLKLNHNATKHPRPHSLAQWVELAKNCKEDLDHRKQLADASKMFRARAGSATKFEDVKIPTKKLYDSVVVICAGSLNDWCPRLSLADELFTFLVGEGFVKAITELNGAKLRQVRIHRYDRTPRPSAVVAVAQPNGHLLLQFSNGWELDLRLHTASSRIARSGQLSLKFDSQVVKSPGLPTMVLKPV